MSAEPSTQAASFEQLVSVLKEILQSDEPTEQQFAELGESLFASVTFVLSGSKELPA